MTSRSFVLYTGLFVLVLGAALVASAFFLRGCHMQREPYVVVSELAVSGLRSGSVVYYRGVEAGQVESIRVDPSDSRRILVAIEVDRDIPVTRSTFASLHLEGVTGSTYLGLDDTGADRTRLPTSSEHPGRIPMHPSFFDQLASASETLLAQLTRLTQNLNQAVGVAGPERIERILANVEQATGRLVEVEAQVQRALGGVPGLVKEGRGTLERFNGLMAKFDEVAGGLKELAVEATRLSAAMGTEVNQNTLPRVNAALEQVTRASEDLQRLARELRRNPRGFLLGTPKPPPGPGERGYRAPGR